MNRNEHDLSVGEQESSSLQEQHAPENSAQQQQITPALFAAHTSTTAAPPPQQTTDGKDIQVQVLSPIMNAQHARSIPLPKGNLELLLQGTGVAALREEKLMLLYYSKRPAGEQSESTQEISHLIKPLLQEQEEGTYKLVVPLDFTTQIPELKARDFLKFNLLGQPSAQITYNPQDKVQIGDAEEVAASKKEMDQYFGTTYLKEEDLALLQAYLPDLETGIKRHPTSNKPYVSTTFLKETLQAKELPTLDMALLETLSQEELSQQQAEYDQQMGVLQGLVYKLDYLFYPYEQLESNYEGEQATDLFDAAYQETVRENQAVKASFVQQLATLQSRQQQVYGVLEQKSIPTEILALAAAVDQQKTNINTCFQLLEGDLQALKVLPLNFADWSKNIKALEEVPAEAEARYKQAKEGLLEGMRAYEKANPSIINNKAYKAWQTQYLQAAHRFQTDISKNRKKFEDFVQKKKVPLAATGGDGKLEHRAGENKVSQKEKARFGDPDNSSKLVFKSLQVPANEGGISPEDVLQGGVGDCYLMTAMMLVAEEDTKHLIEQMIVEKADLYVVTFYSNGMPVEVEVDKKILWLEFADGGGREVGARTERKIWPAIIEKAYAKFQESMPTPSEQLALAEAGDYENKLPFEPEDYGGDYTNIEGALTSQAIEAMVGNRLSKDNYIYLDEVGAVSEEATPRVFSTRLMLQNGEIGEQDLVDLLQGSDRAGYKMDVGSPETMEGVEGLSHDHLMEISSGVYMKFKHSYVVGGVSEKGVTLLDPHGDVTVKNQKEKLYSPALATLVEDFYAHLSTLREELEGSGYKGFSVQTDTGMTDYIDLLKESAKESDKDTKMLLNEVEKNWKRLNNKDKLTEEDGRFVGLRPKTARNILEVLLTRKEELSGMDIGKGFGIIDDDLILGKQDVDYRSLRRFFDSIRISKIKK